MAKKKKKPTVTKKKDSKLKGTESKIPKWGSKKKKVKTTYWIIEETANKIRAIALREGRSQGDVVSEYMSQLVNVKCSADKSIVPIPKRKTSSE